jgi:hypothetical protein
MVGNHQLDLDRRVYVIDAIQLLNSDSALDWL